MKSIFLHTLISMTLSLPIFVGYPMSAHAGHIRERCNEDMINDTQHADGRNLWALRCGLIDNVDLDYAKQRGFYITTVRGVAPSYANAPCAKFERFTWCPIDCFSNMETLLFDGQAITLPDAAVSRRETVTILAEQSTASHLILEEQEIDYYTTGEEHQDMMCLEDDNGRKLKVTLTHPMLLADGTILAAGELSRGALLLGIEGARTLAFARRCPSDGPVWNVRPKSALPLHNTVIAEGYVTGSSRFQNEWASEAYRHSLRRAFMREDG